MADPTMAAAAMEDGELLGVVHRAREALGCDEAGLIHLRGASPMAVAHTSQTAGNLDRTQCDVGEGPSLDAIRQLQAMCVADVRDLTWWPTFRRVALDSGVRSCLAVPLTDGSDVVGALGFYSSRVNALTGSEEIALQAADPTGSVMAPRQDRTLPDQPRHSAHTMP